MYLIYIDDSGKPLRSEKTNFCYAACLLHEDEWSNMDALIDNLQEINRKVIGCGEVHLKEILNSEVPKETKLKLLDQIYSEILKINFIIIFTAIVKNRLKKDFDFKLIALTRLYEKINLFLFYKNRVSKNVNHGFMIFDDEGNGYNQETNLLMNKLFSDGSKYVKNHFLIEEPLIAKSDLKSGVQLADAIVVCIRRHYDYLSKIQKGETPNEFDILFEKYYGLLSAKLYTDNGKIYGITEYPKE